MGDFVTFARTRRLPGHQVHFEPLQRQCGGGLVVSIVDVVVLALIGLVLHFRIALDDLEHRPAVSLVVE